VKWFIVPVTCSAFTGRIQINREELYTMNGKKVLNQYVCALGMASVVLIASHAGIASEVSYPSLSRPNVFDDFNEVNPNDALVALAKAPPVLGATVLRYDSDHIACGLPKTEMELALFEKEDHVQLRYIKLDNNPHVVNGQLYEQSTGAKIIMRGTEQLEKYPQAKEAFLKAASVWESIILDSITVVLDVDFGPERFGEPYPQYVLGSTDPQLVLSMEGYDRVRDALIASATSEPERAHYDRLPVNTVMTDVGPTANVMFPSAVFRALGLIDPNADPEKETGPLSGAPSIGFNSNFTWDFNPDDGIEPGKHDFVGVAIHEMGHALGFVSRVGIHELAPQFPITLSTWDLNRLIPGAGADFTHAPRVLSSGGDHVQYSEQGELPLSTGRPDGTGGDGNQASHWKDDDLYNGQYIGIMDPTAPSNFKLVITDNDIFAADLIGYEVSFEFSNILLPLSPVGETSDRTPEFRWTAMQGAKWYFVFVQEAERELFVLFNYVTDSAADCESGSGECAFTPNHSFIVGETYRWWVGALDEQGSPLGVSDTATFTVR
jgi:hypothetical protein